MPAEDVTDLATLNDLLDAYRVPPGSRATILEAVAAARADGMPVVVRKAAGGDHVSLGPPGSVIAAFVHPHLVRIALDRKLAIRATQEHEFCRLEEGNGIGGRVHLQLEQWAVHQHAVVVRGLLLAAFRAAAPRPAPSAAGARGVRAGASGSTRGRTAPAKPGVCPVHFVELIDGRCDFCDA